jgi:hypothetical protein
VKNNIHYLGNSRVVGTVKDSSVLGLVTRIRNCELTFLPEGIVAATNNNIISCYLGELGLDFFFFIQGLLHSVRSTISVPISRECFCWKFRITLEELGAAKKKKKTRKLWVGFSFGQRKTRRI